MEHDGTDMTSPFHTGNTLRDDAKTYRRLEINFTRNKKQDHTALLDDAAGRFEYEACREQYWNPEQLSLCYGTPIWDQADEGQRRTLNQLYWVAYYSQIISAEIATIFFNQTSAAGLYALEDFRLVCDTLDLESAQERAHIDAFKRVSERVEQELFGERIFSYSMRGPYDETMIRADTHYFRRQWKKLQLRSYGLLSSGFAFIACQYFTIRALRTLNGKLIQHQLAQFFPANASTAYEHEGQTTQSGNTVPSAISYYHFQDESYHFNSSMLLAQDVLRSLPPPTAFEKKVANMALLGCQKDHANFSTAVNGIFWYDPAVFPSLYRVLTSSVFGLERQEAVELLRATFCEENAGMHASYETHQKACASYRKFLDGMTYVSPGNLEMKRMGKMTLGLHLKQNRKGFRRFEGALV